MFRRWILIKERKILQDYISRNSMKYTKQREVILEVFLATEGHVSVEELHQKLSEVEPSVSLATVYRTLNLFCKAGLAQKRKFGEGQTRYEHSVDHSHHDHLICTSCGKIIEFENSMIEQLQRQVAERNDFLVKSHRLEMYGLCADCRKKSASSS